MGEDREDSEVTEQRKDEKKTSEKEHFFAAEEKKLIWAESKYTYNPQKQEAKLRGNFCLPHPILLL